MIAPEKIRVIYDVSFFAGGNASFAAKTGVGRVIENVAELLCQSSEIELLMAGCYGSDPRPGLTSARARTYWEGRWRDRGVPFIESTRSRTSLYSSYRASLEAANSWEGSTLSLPGKIWRKTLNAISRLDAAPKQLGTAAHLFHSSFLPLPVKTFSGPMVVTVHDLIPLADPPDSFSRRMLEDTLNRIELARCWILSDSEHTKKALCSTIPVPSDRVLVCPLAAGAVFRPVPDRGRYQEVSQRLGLPQAPFFFSVSNPQPRKNMPFLIRCFQEFALRENAHHLVLAGSREFGSGWDAIDRQVAAVPSVRGRIHFLGSIRDDDLAVLYTRCAGFVFPSLDEGFGLTPLEAMQCGAPVICSNAASLPEVTGDAAWSIAPTDGRGLVAALHQFAEQPQLRARFSSLGLRRATLFSWDKTAGIVLDAYRHAVK